jgi:hypothetical protein
MFVVVSVRPAIVGLIVGVGLLSVTKVLLFDAACLPLCHALHYPANEMMMVVDELVPLRTQWSAVTVENTIFVLLWMGIGSLAEIKGFRKFS